MLLLLFLGGAQGLVGVVFGLKRRDVKWLRHGMNSGKQYYYTARAFLSERWKKDTGRGVKGDVTKAVFSSDI
jgi:hypothetical protein